MPTRVLHLVKTADGATWALRQQRELVKLGFEVHTALPAGGRLVPDYEAAGVTVHPGAFSLPAARPWRWPALFGDLRRLVAEVQPDLIHAHHVGTALTMRLALGRNHPLPRVFQVPGPLHLEHPFFRNAEIRSAGKPDSWVGSCRWTCDRYRKSGIAEDRIFLSYYGCDIDEFVPRNTGTLRRELGIGPRTKVVGMVAFMYGPKRYLGQTRGLKGHEDLIDALVLCLEKEPDLVGVFVGGPWGGATAYERRVRAYAAERLGDRARFLGTRSDVPDLYPDLDVAVCPSHSENVGAAVESLLLEVPTITTDVGGFPDLVIPGETGWLVKPRDPAQLAATILEALGDPEAARVLARNGRDRARKLLDIRTNAAEIAGVYRTILGDVVGVPG